MNIPLPLPYPLPPLPSIMDRLPIFERRLLPLRSLASQTSYAASISIIIRTCPDTLKLTPEIAAFISDAAAIMELDDAQVRSCSRPFSSDFQMMYVYFFYRHNNT
jgi:hypothetical protein